MIWTILITITACMDYRSQNTDRDIDAVFRLTEHAATPVMILCLLSRLAGNKVKQPLNQVDSPSPALA